MNLRHRTFHFGLSITACILTLSMIAVWNVSGTLAAEDVSTSDPVKEQVDALNEQIRKNRSRVNELQGVIKKYQDRIQEQESAQVTLENEIGILENRVAQKQISIEQTKAQLEATRLEILSLDTQIKSHNSKITEQKEQTAELIRQIDQQDAVSIVQVLLAHPRLSTFFDRIEEDKRVERQLSSALEQVKKEKTALEATKKDQDEKRVQLDLDKKRLVKEELVLEAEKNFKTSLIETTKNSQVEFERTLYELQQQQQSTSDDIATLETKLKDKLDVVDKALARGDILLNWPVDPSRGITATFHDTTYPFKNLFQHPGTDIRASVGTVVKSAAGGYVAWNKQGRLYGNYIMVVHPGNIATVYAHLSKFIAKPDTYIERGEAIALSGGRPGDPGAGLSTGPHLHFEVRQNGIPVNPENFLPSLD